MSSLADVLLVAALVVTSLFVLSMQRRLKRLDASHAEYQQALSQTAAALFAARDALDRVNTDGRVVAAQLGEEIAQAKLLAAQIEQFRHGALADIQPFAGDSGQRRRRPLSGQGAPADPAHHAHAGSLRQA